MPVKQQQWTPTARRGPIAAEMKAPAPNSVDLPPLFGLSLQILHTKKCDKFANCITLLLMNCIAKPYMSLFGHLIDCNI